MYKVLYMFTDKTNGHVYHAGDSYPYDGSGADPKRAAELAGSRNAAGRPLIKAAAQPKKKKEPGEA